MMEKQMEMFEDGGLKDEGGMINKESGNKVPSGSTRKEVRDDIPAQLSEGEFVFPADVVRFVGLEKLMKLRQQAKMGLKKMEDMGQMGNSDEAILPDDLPFDETDLLVLQDGKPMQMAKGGILTASDGTDVRKLPIQQSAREQAEASFFNFDDLFGTGAGGQQLSIKEYKNEDGLSIRIRFVGNVPIDNIPEGYYPVDADGNIIKPDDPEAPEQPKEPVETEEERIKRRQSEGGPDNPEAGKVRGYAQMTPQEVIDFDKLMDKVEKFGPIGRVVSNIDKENRKAQVQVAVDKQKADKRKQDDLNTLAKERTKKDEAEGSSSTPSVSSNAYSFEGDSGMGGAISEAGGVGQDFEAPPGQDATNTGGGSGISANVPDYDFDFGAGGADGSSSAPSKGDDFDPSGRMSKGGLGTKPKKKAARKMKKGGLAASKK